MTNYKKVGVIIPIYNVEKYLKECLDSVINQTYKNLEIILVNDGSTDNSLDIAKDYAKNDPRITIINKQNGGQSSARNVGIEYFSGEYSLEYCKNIDGLEEYNIKGNNPLNIHNILNQNKINVASQIDYLIFLDSDDYWELECIEECVSRMVGVDIVWFDAKTFFDGAKSDWVSNLKWLDYNYEQIITRKNWLDRIRFKRQSFFYFAWQGMIDFKFLKDIKLKFINHIIHEDDHFGILMFLQIRKIYILPKELYNYRIRNNSTVTYDMEVPKNRIPPYFRHHLSIFNNNPTLTYKYFRDISWMKTTLGLIEFLQVQDAYTKSVISKYLLPTYIDSALGIVDSSADPLNLILELSKLESYVDNNRKIYGAQKIIKDSVAYKIGFTILRAKTIKKILALPNQVSTFIKNEKEVKKLYKDRIIKYPFAKKPDLKNYTDYHEVSKIKSHLSYKLGIVTMRAYKFRYFGGWLVWPFCIAFTAIKFKLNQKNKGK
ncbi:glycosyltransferase family 2 protein [Campylobacter lanienae]|uniref:glycosyltransferase family 2 protein n=1 Tax=Campylobacter lanienae TaxID=75658 RepID=UPI000BB40D25|nr:glycosyltransferase family 2 protein [Campylobacter lanienae]